MLNTYQMADVGQKQVTHRVAVAQGCITMGQEAFLQLKNKTLPKGDPIPMAETAGIMAAKRTPEFIPLCHPLSLEKVELQFRLDSDSHSLWAECKVSAHEKTGVEMEALVGVQAALLTIYDLVKPVDPALTISNIRLNSKQGGKKGHWLHPEFSQPSVDDSHGKTPLTYEGIQAAVLTMSDRAANHEYEDKSGQLLKQTLEAWQATVVDYSVVSDEPSAIRDKLVHYCDQLAVPLVLTTGGTGMAPRDNTPEVIGELCDRTIPGIGELLRQHGAQYTINSWLSRSVAGIRKQTLIVTLPGSPKAVQQCIEVLQKPLRHAVGFLNGCPGHISR